MFIYFGRNYISNVSGSAVREVHCEKCGADFRYRLIRGARSTASAHYNIGESSAASSAQLKARRKLEEHLANDIDPVFCPKCNWLQSFMVRELRRRKLVWLKWSIVYCPILACAFAFITASTQSYGFRFDLQPEQRLLVLMILLAGIGLGLAGLLGRRLILSSSDPNANYPDTPDPIIGAPRGWLAIADFAAVGGDLTNAVVVPQAGAKVCDDPSVLPLPHPSKPALLYEQRPPAMDSAGWITTQIRHIPILRSCCNCLEPTETGLQFVIGGATRIYMPICPACVKKRGRAQIFGVLLGTFVGLLIAAIVIFLISGYTTDPGAYFILGVGATSSCACLGRPIGLSFATPVRFRGYSVTLNTVRIQFRNPAFRNIFLESLAAMQSAVY